MPWQLALTGLVVGVLVGLTGMGGGSLMTPVLVFVFGFNPAAAVGTDILHGAIFKSVGAIRQGTLGNVKAQLSGWMLLGSAPLSLAGVALAAWIAGTYGDGFHSVGGKVLGAALVAGGAGLLLKSLVSYRDRPATLRMTRRDRLLAVSIGAAGGLVVGLTSVGSGIFFALSLLILFPLRSAKVVGTDILHAAALLWVAGIGHLVVGTVELETVGWLLIGSIPGVLLGSQFTVRVPERSLRVVLAVTLTVAGVKLVDLPGSTVLAVVVLAGGSLWLLAPTFRRIASSSQLTRARQGSSAAHAPPT